MPMDRDMLAQLLMQASMRPSAPNAGYGSSTMEKFVPPGWLQGANPVPSRPDLSGLEKLVPPGLMGTPPPDPPPFTGAPSAGIPPNAQGFPLEGRTRMDNVPGNAPGGISPEQLQEIMRSIPGGPTAPGPRRLERERIAPRQYGLGQLT